MTPQSLIELFMLAEEATEWVLDAQLKARIEGRLAALRAEAAAAR